MALLKSKPCHLDLTDIFQKWKSQNLKRFQRAKDNVKQSERLLATEMLPTLKIKSTSPLVRLAKTEMRTSTQIQIAAKIV